MKPERVCSTSCLLIYVAGLVFCFNRFSFTAGLVLKDVFLLWIGVQGFFSFTTGHVCISPRGSSYWRIKQ